LEIRVEEEDVEITEEAIDLLTKIGNETSLRYAIQLITSSKILSIKRNADKIDIEDISKSFNVFIDVRRSTQYLIAHQEQFRISEMM